jgi:hypothetical protein
MAMAERKNIEFGVEGGVTLRGWLFVPGAKGPAPAITMAHGYAGVKEHGLERFARAFAEAGFVVLVHDHRHFGASDGVERGDVDPWQQIADWRRAISFLESRPEVDAAQIGQPNGLVSICSIPVPDAGPRLRSTALRPDQLRYCEFLTTRKGPDDECNRHYENWSSMECAHDKAPWPRSRFATR